jgi:hypothetical protein
LKIIAYILHTFPIESCVIKILIVVYEILINRLYEEVIVKAVKFVIPIIPYTTLYYPFIPPHTTID